MVDALGLFANTLWITGCAMALAVVSYASWQAAVRGEKLRVQLDRPTMQRLICLAGVLFCAGLTATADTLVEIILWAGLGILFLVFTLRKPGDPAG
jgi:cation transport ATPase